MGTPVATRPATSMRPSVDALQSAEGVTGQGAPSLWSSGSGDTREAMHGAHDASAWSPDGGTPRSPMGSPSRQEPEPSRWRTAEQSWLPPHEVRARDGRGGGIPPASGKPLHLCSHPERRVGEQRSPRWRHCLAESSYDHHQIPDAAAAPGPAAPWGQPARRGAISRISWDQRRTADGQARTHGVLSRRTTSPS
jgi:hypothetical protein